MISILAVEHIHIQRESLLRSTTVSVLVLFSCHHVLNCIFMDYRFQDKRWLYIYQDFDQFFGSLQKFWSRYSIKGITSNKACLFSCFSARITEPHPLFKPNTNNFARCQSNTWKLVLCLSYMSILMSVF